MQRVSFDACDRCNRLSSTVSNATCFCPRGCCDMYYAGLPANARYERINTTQYLHIAELILYALLSILFVRH
jgi:hypothetical protein